MSVAGRLLVLCPQPAPSTVSPCPKGHSAVVGTPLYGVGGLKRAVTQPLGVQGWLGKGHESPEPGTMVGTEGAQVPVCTMLEASGPVSVLCALVS